MVIAVTKMTDQQAAIDTSMALEEGEEVQVMHHTSRVYTLLQHLHRPVIQNPPPPHMQEQILCVLDHMQELL